MRKAFSLLYWKDIIIGCARALASFSATIVVLPALVILALMRRWMPIRFGFFTADRIGHWIFDLEYYLSERSLDQKPHHDFFFHIGTTCNYQLEDMAKRNLYLNRVNKLFFLAANSIPWVKNLLIIEPMRTVNGSTDPDGLFFSTRTQLHFTPQEHRAGNLYLSQNGISETDQLVCLIVRDSAYLNTAFPGRDWRYHDYRDTDIADYGPAIMALADRGFWVFRMGKIVRKPLTVRHPRIIDYAKREDRSDFLDLWLIHRCAFCISTSTGLDSVALAFRKPIVTVNLLPISDVRSSHNVVVAPQHLRWTSSGTHLTLDEYLTHNYHSGEAYFRRDIAITHLEPDIIRLAAIEMANRLSTDNPNRQKASQHNQNLFWEKVMARPETKYQHSFLHPDATLCDAFLQNVPDWLD
jgi:putative glycosyltransferase (TIGR04372 family)